MDPNLFDAMARRLARRRLSRRGVISAGVGSLVAGSIAAKAPNLVSAAEIPARASVAVPKAEYMFVQAFQSGNIVPKDGEEGRYVVTLEQGHGQTIYFSNRPDRIVGSTPTEPFLRGLGMAADNPPNAAMILQTTPGESDIAVVELYNPAVDPAGSGVTYEFDVLENWQQSLELGFSQAPTDLAQLAPEFGPAHLFIDDCPSSDIACDCYDPSDWDNPHPGLGWIVRDADMCWNYSLCQPCEPYGHTFPHMCAAWDYWKDVCKTLRPGLYCTPSWDWLMPPLCF